MTQDNFCRDDIIKLLSENLGEDEAFREALALTCDINLEELKVKNRLALKRSKDDPEIDYTKEGLAWAKRRTDYYISGRPERKSQFEGMAPRDMAIYWYYRDISKLDWLRKTGRNRAVRSYLESMEERDTYVDYQHFY
jgi:hypothetical protein